ncbi:hypothetical protein B0A48_15417 [Cryoendolithus antarcticus]|uniref:Uncharacterized protein n=1 Tax=Cryoendolithus antarcticus TaxID=1507870 RepID=A0A1V8SIQ5_9PEZI|nr:hypothetical protein B0A48_15417 [Cryoendolithus antarcticus]
MAANILVLPRELQDLIFDHVIEHDGPITLSAPLEATNATVTPLILPYRELPCRSSNSLLSVSHETQRIYCEAVRRHLILPTSSIRVEVRDLAFAGAIELLSTTSATFPSEVQAQAWKSRLQSLRALTVVLVPVHLRMTITGSSFRCLESQAQADAAWLPRLSTWLDFSACNDVEATYVVRRANVLCYEEYVKRLQNFLRHTYDELQRATTCELELKHNSAVKAMLRGVHMATEEIRTSRSRSRDIEAPSVNGVRYVSTRRRSGTGSDGLTDVERKRLFSGLP